MKTLKYYLLAACLVLIAGTACAQSSLERNADFNIAQQSYEQGIPQYQKILDRKGIDSLTADRVNLKLARIYYTIRQYPNSMKYYNGLLSKNRLDSLNVNDANQILTMLNRMDQTKQAAQWAAVFSKSNEMLKDQRFCNLQRSIMGIELPISGDTLDYTVVNQPFNSAFSDFWTGTIDDSTLLFIRSDAGGDNATRALFQGARFYKFNKQSKAAKPYTEFPIVFQAGPATFYQGHKAMIYTDNNLKSGGAAFKRVTYVSQKNLQLLYAVYNDKKGEWKIAKSIFKSDDPSVSYCHPCLTNHDQTLLFSSNMPGGYGGMDIYKSDWDSTTLAWGTPLNLGPVVNTAGDEIYSMVRDGKLYFSSNGHIGLGGYDIYAANLNNKSEVVGDKVIYLPEPINTRFNDFSLFLGKDKKTGYFTSDRNGGKGIDDIYAFESKPKEKPVVVVPKEKGVDSTDFLIAVVKDEELANLYFDFDKSNIKDQSEAQKALQLMQDPAYKDVKFLLLGSADSRGHKEYNVKLSQRRAESVKAWLVLHGFDGDRLVTEARGAIPLSDAELRKIVGLPAEGPITDAALIRKAYHEARRVTIKTIVPRKEDNSLKTNN